MQIKYHFVHSNVANVIKLYHPADLSLLTGFYEILSIYYRISKCKLHRFMLNGYPTACVYAYYRSTGFDMEENQVFFRYFCKSFVSIYI